MRTRDEIIMEVVQIEGGVSNNPHDRGGHTKFGITEKVARAHGYEGDMDDLTLDFAINIYVEDYWKNIDGDHLLSISDDLAFEVFDTGVNMGCRRAVKFLQRALNNFNRRQKLYSDIVVDGRKGPATRVATSEYASQRDVGVLVDALNSLQGVRYFEIGENDESQEEFMYGWWSHRVSLRG